MKKTTIIDREATAEAKGRKVSVIIHIVFLGLLAFPFMQMVAPETPQDVEIVMDFSRGSSAEGAKAVKKSATTAKSIDVPIPQKAKRVLIAQKEEKVVIKEDAETPAPEIKETKTVPAENSPEVQNINQGVKLIILDQIDNYLKVRLMDYTEAWINEGDIRRI